MKEYITEADKKMLAKELAIGKQTPIINDYSIKLNGIWQAKNILNGKEDTLWRDVEQPGVVLIDDAHQSPDTINCFNRVTQTHHSEDDGAVIKKCFTVPCNWEGKNIIIRFDGIYPAGVIFLNQEKISEQFSGLTPIEIDITDKVKFDKENTISIRLYRLHEFIAMDMPRHASGFCGISRDITLFAADKRYIADFTTKVEVRDRTGIVNGKALLVNTLREKSVGELDICLINDDSSEIVTKEIISLNFDSNEMTVSFSLSVDNPHLWDDEEPFLYNLKFTLRIEGQEDQIFSLKIGFRDFICKNGISTINGNPVKFRGVNLLSIHHKTGMYVEEDFMRQSIIMMKRANINCIRTHFFSPEYLPRLCNEMGIYLIQELPIDWGHPYLGKENAKEPMLQRLEDAVRRDRNYTSIMLWSIGNENMALDEGEYETLNYHLKMAKEQVHALDYFNRMHIFPPPGPANVIKGILEAKYGEIADIHYSFKLIRQLYEERKITNPRTWGMDVLYNPTTGPTFEDITYDELKNGGWSEVWFSSEWGITNLLSDPLFTPYNVIITDNPEDPFSGKSIQNAINDRFTNEWGLMRDDPHCLGGAFFAWIAPGVGDSWGWDRWAEDADWGIVLPDLTAKSVFWVAKNQFSPLQFPKEIIWDKDSNDSITFELYNGCTHFNLNELTIYHQLSNYSTWIERNFSKIEAAGNPGETSFITIPLKKNSSALNALNDGNKIIVRLTVLRPDGSRIIQSDIIVVPQNAESAKLSDELFIGPDVKIDNNY